jgi:hypothetical protein
MKIVGDYQRDGYALVESLVSTEIARAVLKSLHADVGGDAIRLSGVDQHPNLLKRAAFEMYGHHHSPLLFLLWGLTPTVSGLVGRDLLPTYDYFRIYREGDVCLVHSDRYACEHSLSLTLDYSDGVPWDLEIGKIRRPQPSSAIDEDFGTEPFASLPMQVGDAVLYQGVHHRHARTQPNPNGWSAHLFLHWVERDGAYRDHAFDGRGTPAQVNFSFA